MLRRGMINLVSMWESKNKFDSSNVLTGQVNFGTTKGTFLYFFFRGVHTTQLNQGSCAQRGYLFNHFGTGRGMHRQPGLTATACVVSLYTCVPVNLRVFSFNAVVCLLLMCLYACNYNIFFIVFFLISYLKKSATFGKAGEMRNWQSDMVSIWFQTNLWIGTCFSMATCSQWQS